MNNNQSAPAKGGMRMRYLMNVSKQERKIDNVTYSGLVWHGFRSVLPVPEHIAVKLLQYPDVWVEVDPATGEPIAQAAVAASFNPTPELKKAVREAIQSLDPTNPEHFDLVPSLDAIAARLGHPVSASVRDAVWAEMKASAPKVVGLALGDKEPAKEPTKAKEPEKPQEPEKGPGPSSDGQQTAQDGDLIPAIIAAINKLDPLSPADYTNDGIPRVEAIEKVLGKNITAKQRDVAWAELQKGKSTGA